MNKHDVNVIMPTGRESCLSSAAESSWLSLLPYLSYLFLLEKKKLSTEITYKIPVLFPTYLSPCTLGMMNFLRKTSICLSSPRTHTMLPTDIMVTAGFDAGFNRSGTWVSTFSSFAIWRTAGKWTPLICWRREGWGWLNNLGIQSPEGKGNSVRKQSLRLASFLPTRQGLKPTREGISSMNNQWQRVKMLLMHCSMQSSCSNNLLGLEHNATHVDST